MGLNGGTKVKRSGIEMNRATKVERIMELKSDTNRVEGAGKCN